MSEQTLPVWPEIAASGIDISATTTAMRVPVMVSSMRSPSVCAGVCRASVPCRWSPSKHLNCRRGLEDDVAGQRVQREGSCVVPAWPAGRHGHGLLPNEIDLLHRDACILSWKGGQGRRDVLARDTSAARSEPEAYPVRRVL